MAANFPAAFPGAPGKASASAEMSPFSWQDAAQRNAWIAAVAAAVVLVWSYWMVFRDAASQWDQPQYSHGWLIPLFALVMMWMLRPNKTSAAERGLHTVGGVSLALIAVAQAMPSMGWLSGVGLALACVGGFACALWDQPFAPQAGKDVSGIRFSRSDLLWSVTGVGLVLTVLGLVGVGVGPLSPDVFSFLGLTVIAVGYVLIAAFALQPTVVGAEEVIAGLVVVLLGCASWAMGVYYDRMPLTNAAFISSAIGLLTVIGGMRLVRWTGPPVAFLIFMFPLPDIVERNVLGALQKVAVYLSEMVYTIIGIPAIRQGSRISLPGLNDSIEMEIAEACSGLSMTNILVAMCIAIAILTTRPWWDRLIVVLSALPIAIVANVFRIVVTGLIWMAMDQVAAGDSEYMDRLRDPIHSWIGLIVMMPFALGLMLIELKILSLLSVPEESALGKTQVVGRGGASGAPIQ